MPAGGLRPDIAHALVRDELFLDGNARQNLATFCQTYLNDDIHQLMDMSLDKNMIDKDEYPATAELLVAFFPPDQLPVGSPVLYVTLVIVGTVLFCGIPHILHEIRQPNWAKGLTGLQPAE